MSNVFSIAVSGLSAAISKMSNAATNIVNASSTGKLLEKDGEKATSFVPRDVVTLSESVGDDLLGVRTESVSRDPSYYPMYEPSSPYANEAGLVAAPNVDLTKEIVDMMMAEVAYKANAKAIAVEKKNEETLLDTLA